VSKLHPQKVIDFLSEKWGGKGCPMCGKGPWNVPDNTFQLMEFHSGNLVMGGPLIPVIPVSCGNCGNTVLVNAIIAGVVKPESPSPTQEKK